MTSLWRKDRDEALARDILPADGRFDDVVVGAGLTGLTVALLLARAGRRVGVVEARQVGAITTGHTTAKVSLLQGTKLSRLRHRQPQHVAAAYVEANREGMEWLLRFCDDHEVSYQRRDALTYATSPSEVSSARAEHEAARAVGLPTRWVDTYDVPFPFHGAVLLPDQAQFHPLDVTDALVQQLRLHGGTVHEGLRVRSISKSGRPHVRLDDGTELEAEHVVLATGTPILDRGLHFARLEPKRSYALAFANVTPPEAMFLSAGSSTRSVRDVPLDDQTYLLVGGAGHTVGRTGSTTRHLEELREWTASYFPSARETHAWSAQDYASYDEVPIVGRMPLSGGHVFVATGFDKWGMTNAVAAAHTISADVLGGRTPGYRSQGLHPTALLNVGRINAGVVKALLRAPMRSDTRRACLEVGLCTHLGGPLTWNDAERSWDCAWHGSRFAEDGNVLEGPATRPLRHR